MRVLLPAIVAALAFQGVSASQIVITEKAPASAKQGDEKTDALFYKAFFLDNGAGQYEQALGLYKKFLAAAPESKLAPRAARSLVNLLYRTEKMDEARAAQEKYAALLARAPRGEGRMGRGGPGDRMGRGARGARGERGARGARGGGAGDAEQAQRIKRMVTRLEGQIAEAKEAGNEEQVARLSRQLDRIKTRLKEIESGGGEARGGRGMGRGQGGRRGGFGRQRALTDMEKDEALQWVERRTEMMERFADRIGEERAAEMEKALKECKAAIEAGDMKKAEKIRQEKLSFRRRR